MTLALKRVKINEMTGYPLSFIVALAEGYEYTTDEKQKDDNFLNSNYLSIDEHRDECGVVVSPYSGADYYTPSNNWNLAGPLFDKYNPKTSSDYNNEVLEVRIELNGKTAYGKGRTYMLALCRAIGYYHFGEYAEVPSILVRHMESSTIKKYIVEKDPEFGVCVNIEFLDGSINFDHKPDKAQSVEDFIDSCKKRAKKFKFPIEINL
jgi:hypothetical protein